MGLHLVSLQVFEISSRKNENFSNQRFDILNNNRKEYVYCECKFFEKKLGLDMRTILKDLSRNYLMFIQWEGVVKDDRLCFLTSDSSNFIDLSEISHLTI